MKIPDGHFRHILLYYFQKGKNAVQVRKKLNEYRFPRFHSENFDLKDASRSGSSTEVDDDKIIAMIENNRRSTTR